MSTPNVGYQLYLPPHSVLVDAVLNTANQDLAALIRNAYTNNLESVDCPNLFSDKINTPADVAAIYFWNPYNEALVEKYQLIVERRSVVVRQRQPTVPTSVIGKHVNMKDADFFNSTRTLASHAARTMNMNIETNTKLTPGERILAKSVVAFVRQLDEGNFFALAPRDFLQENVDRVKNVTPLTVIAYGVYDILHASIAFMRLKPSFVRQVIVPKEKPSKKERRLFVTVCKNGVVTFDSPAISELVLTLIEKGVLRCGSIARCFLVTADNNVFYKYCLIRGKVCLKQISDRQTIRI